MDFFKQGTPISSNASSLILTMASRQVYKKEPIKNHKSLYGFVLLDVGQLTKKPLKIPRIISIPPA